jgi:hypothetical protein
MLTSTMLERGDALASLENAFEGLHRRRTGGSRRR